LAILSAKKDSVDAVYSDLLRIKKDGSYRYYKAPDINLSRVINLKNNEYSVCDINITSLLMRRKCIDRVGCLNEKFRALEDLEFLIRLSKIFRLYHVQEALVKYYETDGVSSDYGAKAHAKLMLLLLYFKEVLARPSFVAKQILDIWKFSAIDYKNRRLERIKKRRGRQCPKR
jgi:hypothetical protein